MIVPAGSSAIHPKKFRLTHSRRISSFGSPARRSIPKGVQHDANPESDPRCVGLRCFINCFVFNPRAAGGCHTWGTDGDSRKHCRRSGPVSLQSTGVISGTVNANITNPSVPVSISGTPNVNVANSPTVSLATGTSVRDADNPARQFYTAETGAALTLAGGLATFNPVPSGKVLVVEHVSLRVDDIIPSGARYLPRFLVPDSANTSTDDQFPLTLVLQDTDFWVASETVRFYFPAGTSPALVVEPGSGSPTSGIADVSISGYLVNIP